jgi:hypothetical protein
MASPYRTDAQIEKEYLDAYARYKAAQQGQADRQKAQKDTEYDDTQRQGYVNYMQNKKDIPGYLANLGIAGGGTETTALRADTNYQNAHQSVEKKRNADKTAIDNSLRDTLNQYKMVADENMRKEKQQENQLRIAYAKEQQRLEEERFAKTVSGYNDIGEIDRFLEYIRTSGVAPWRADYLRARRAELMEKQALAAASGGSSGGSSRSSGGSRGASTTTSNTGGTDTSAAIAAARAALASWGSSSTKSSGKSTKSKSKPKWPSSSLSFSTKRPF